MYKGIFCYGFRAAETTWDAFHSQDRWIDRAGGNGANLEDRTGSEIDILPGLIL